MSLLQIAETAGVGSTTNPLRSTTPIVKALGRLERMGLIRRDHSGRSAAAFKNATRIHLVLKPMNDQFASTDGDANQKQETGGTSSTNYSLTSPPGVIEHESTPPRIWCAPISIDELLHPLWEEHHGIGMAACSIWAVLRSFNFATTTTIAKATGRSASQIRKLLQKLERQGLVTSSPDHHWQIVAKTIQELDVAASGLGLTAQREKRRAINVARRVNYSQVLEIRRQAWKEAQRVDWEWDRFVDPHTGELLAEPFPSELEHRSAMGALAVTSGGRNGPQRTI
jgi:DNA-binding MarR family transcriptional regulator